MNDNVLMERDTDSLLAEPAPSRTFAPFAAAPPAPAESEMPQYLRAVFQAPPPPPPSPVSRPKRWLCFDVVGQSFAVELLKVQEVLRVPAIVPVRGSAADVLGVINLRGEIVHVLDLGTHLGFSPCDVNDPAARVILLEEKGAMVGVLVSRVADVATLDDSDIERAGSALRPFPCSALVGVARHAKTLLALLDASEFLK